MIHEQDGTQQQCETRVLGHAMAGFPLIPPYNRYIVEMQPEREQRTASGIFIPKSLEVLDARHLGDKEDHLGAQEMRKAEIREFVVVSVGPGLWEAGARQTPQYAVGQTLLAHRPHEVDGFDWQGLRYYVLAETDVVAGLSSAG